jgi:uncharacterized membrane protein
MSDLPQLSKPDPSAVEAEANDEPVAAAIATPAAALDAGSNDSTEASPGAAIASSQPAPPTEPPPTEPPPSYVKLAMRNMVKKRGTSIQHFALTTAGLIGLLLGLAYLTH